MNKENKHFSFQRIFNDINKHIYLSYLMIKNDYGTKFLNCKR